MYFPYLEIRRNPYSNFCMMKCLIVFLYVPARRYLSVFSEKLAIQGPPGSVIRSVTFLKSYERHILGTFTINIGVTAITTIFQFYCFMVSAHVHISIYLLTLVLLIDVYFFHWFGVVAFAFGLYLWCNHVFWNGTLVQVSTQLCSVYYVTYRFFFFFEYCCICLSILVYMQV